jgi:hypothetical protein
MLLGSSDSFYLSNHAFLHTHVDLFEKSPEDLVDPVKRRVSKLALEFFLLAGGVDGSELTLALLPTSE